LEVVFLGTSGSVPTPERGLPAVAVRRGGELLLLDCGEGTQRQMMRAKVGFPTRFRIFITHLHGDHVFGIPGLLHTMALMNRDAPLEIYGPKGLANFVRTVLEVVHMKSDYPVYVREVGDGVVYDGGDYVVRACWVSHGVPALAYAVEEKPRPGRFHPERARALGVPMGPLWKRLQMGKAVRLPDGRLVRPEDVLGPARPGLKLVYSGDTGPCEALVELARGADLLIHEATLGDEHTERAIAEGHSTPSIAAQTALKAGVKRLVLTHISARYRDTTTLLEQARATFPNTIVAEDLMRISLRYENR